jgi:CheY-like chemotaxis protein
LVQCGHSPSQGSGISRALAGGTNFRALRRIVVRRHAPEDISRLAAGREDRRDPDRCPERPVLIVDDLEANVLLLERVLRGAGYTSVASTMNPRAVCGLHRKNRYEPILLDLEMPGMDGFEVMQALKEIETGGYLPVLAVTMEPGHKLRALKDGAKDFISKPLDLNELLARVHNMLEVRLSHREAREQSELLERIVQQRTADAHHPQRELRTGFPCAQAMRRQPAFVPAAGPSAARDPSTGRTFPSTTTYGAQRKGRGSASASAPWENASPFGGFAQRCSRKVQARRSPQLLTSCGLHLLGPSERRPNGTSAYQGLARSHRVTATAQLRNEPGRPSLTPRALPRTSALGSPPPILQRERPSPAIGRATQHRVRFIAFASIRSPASPPTLRCPRNIPPPSIDPRQSHRPRQ